MVNANSPGVYVLEQDNSEFAPNLNSSVAGLVGFATKGPTNQATLITGGQRLVDTFGAPEETLPGQALEGALEILETTDQLYFVRAVVDSAADASATINLGACPAGAVVASGFGVTENLYLKVQVKDNNGTEQFAEPKEFNIPSGTADSQVNALIKVLGAGSFEGAKVGAHSINGTESTSGAIVGSFAGSGAEIQVSAYIDSSFVYGASALKPLTILGAVSSTPPASSISINGATLKKLGSASSTGYLCESIYPGTGYNLSSRADGTTLGNSIEIIPQGGRNVLIQVNDRGSVAEQFKVSLVASGDFVEDVINTGETTLISRIIKGNLVDDLSDADVTALTNFSQQVTSLGITNTVGQGFGETSETEATPRFVKFVQGTVGLAGGTNGTGTTTQNNVALIGDSANGTGMQALDDDSLNISMAAVPGFNNQDVQNALITLAETSQNFVAVVAPPFGLANAQEAIDWHNGQADSRTAAINSSYAAIYWPWVQVFDVFAGKDRWYDPVIFAIRQMAFTDAVSDPWFAPAGLARGRLTKPSDVEVKINSGDNNSLYSGGNVINPIRKFDQDGLVVWGQRTSSRLNTALNRVNIRRMMIYIRKVALAANRIVVFEPNDPFTWSRVEGILNPILEEIRRRRGITEFRVVVDDTVNTPERIDRNELWAKVLIKPTKTAEIIVVELNLTNQSAQLGL